MIAKCIRQATPGAVVAYASQEGTATCVGGSFPMDLEPAEITLRFRDVMELRPDLTQKVLHFPVRLTEQDRELSPAEWGHVARELMKSHGLEDAPWQAWLHVENGHSHMHLVALNVTFDGTRIDLGGDRFTRQKFCTRMEKEFGLWRAPRVRGGELLPPVGEDAPKVTPAAGKVTLNRDRIRTRIRPGMTLPELRDELQLEGVELVPKFSRDGSKITGLGFRFQDTFVKASEVDRGFSLAGLQSQGVSYVPARDLPKLSPAPPPLIQVPVSVPKPVSPPVPEIALPTLVIQPPTVTYEVPRVEPYWPPSFFDVRNVLALAKQLALRLFRRVSSGEPEPPIPQPGVHHLG